MQSMWGFTCPSVTCSTSINHCWNPAHLLLWDFDTSLCSFYIPIWFLYTWSWLCFNLASYWSLVAYLQPLDETGDWLNSRWVTLVAGHWFIPLPTYCHGLGFHTYFVHSKFQQHMNNRNLYEYCKIFHPVNTQFYWIDGQANGQNWLLNSALCTHSTY